MSDNEEKKVVSLAGARESKDKEKTQEEAESSSTEKKPVYCSFCERPNYQVIKMIEGPGVNICSECTMICVQYFMIPEGKASQEARAVLDSFWNISKRT